MARLRALPTYEAEQRLDATRGELARLIAERQQGAGESFPRSHTMRLLLGAGGNRWRELLFGAVGGALRRGGLWRYAPLIGLLASIFEFRRHRPSASRGG